MPSNTKMQQLDRKSGNQNQNLRSSQNHIFSPTLQNTSYTKPCRNFSAHSSIYQCYKI